MFPSFKVFPTDSKSQTRVSMQHRRSNIFHKS